MLKLISDIKKSGKGVTLVWIPAHVGIPGNEKADQLAKAATNKKEIEVEMCPSLKDAKRHAASSLIPIWQERWASTTSSRFYHSIEDRVSMASKYQDVSRRKEILISRFRLGKIALNHFLFSMGVRTDGKCGTCPSEDETPTHFLLECPAQHVMRERILKRIHTLKLREVLSNPASTELLYDWVVKHRPNILSF